MSSNRFLLLAFLGAVLGACAQDPNSIVCPTTGITCPTGTICAAAQPVCLVSSCGNGLTDSGEQCDDGNIHEGDGCSPNCKREECGNSIQDPGEVCDDGNTESGDGCAGDCESEEDCGNGVVDVGEDCDDMNDDNTDACVRCKDAACGDGFKRTGFEECDGDNMGNPNVDGDSCSASCQLEGCHNGRLDPGEECDDMNLDNTDACVFECKDARCGDLVIRAGIEECDGDVGPDDTCSDTCRLNGCGNGIQDPGEQCDDGCLAGVAGTCEPADDGDGCSSSCTFENCGNGVVDSGEQCDGNGTGTGGETADCNIDCTMSVCGDGKRNALDMEECDNGPTSDPTGNGDLRNCTLACKLNFCGDGKVDQQAPGIEACDEGPGGNLDDGMGCSSTCTFEGCGNGVINPGEDCEDGNSINADSCINCRAARCGDGFVHAGFEQCDGTAGTKPAGHNEATCGTTGAAACRWQYCGNGFLEGAEQCDDGNNNSGDGCTASCIREYCGDGVDNNGSAEQCDGGGETATCDIDCSTASCGDGIVNDLFTVPSTGGKKEQCDDGGNANNDGCSSTCQFERCGNNILDNGEQCDGTALPTPPVAGATCGTTGVNACRWVYCGNGILEGTEQCDNGLTGPNANSNTAACKANCTVNTCGDGFVLAGIEGCDDGSANNGPSKDCTALCQPNRCGDGFRDQTGASQEQCDDGNASNADSCTTTCRTPTCGDAQINGSEECDDGNTANGDGCQGNCNVTNNWTCTGTSFSICTRNPGCGNGFKESGEGCDDGDMSNGDGCSSTCQEENGWNCTEQSGFSVCTFPQVCGDGVITAPETCDFGMTDNNGTDCANGSPPAYGLQNACVACTNLCVATVSADFCGDGAINGGGEVCDGAALGGATCMSLGQGTGTLACTAGCTYNTSGCSGFALNVTVTGSGTVSSNPVGITTCGAGGSGDCTNDYSSGTMVTLTATPAQGASFTGWSGACSGMTSTCTVTMTAARNVTAAFSTVFTLNVSITGAGTGSVASNPTGINCPGDCTENYASGMVTLTATAAGGSIFTGWSGACSGTSTTCTVTMSAARNVTANFATAFTLNVGVTGNGTVNSAPTGIVACAAAAGDCDEPYASGTMVTLTATPTAGNVFTGWSGACSGSGTCTVTMSAARNVTATFATAFTLTVTKAGGTGTVSSSPAGISNCGGASMPDCTEDYATGTSVTLTASTATSGWTGCATMTTTTCTVTMDMARAVTATFP
ncbi:MAG: DUF4215 domain-containing protein [Kofleriaceae bacterium]|nr:DUF4215 domain-containing protein [Kofleriaceae bacterium]